jgi:hypothetical protein
MIRQAIRRLLRLTDASGRLLLYDTMITRRRINTLAVIDRERYVKELLSGPRYADERRLPHFGAKVYSQNDEDGIIQEIFSRVGFGNRTFVEFGVDNGLENNTLKLLLEGWTGLWLEGSEEHVKQIDIKFQDVIASGRLRVQQAFVDRNNINDLIKPYYSDEIDLISIDIDGNDIYILEALSIIRPRVIAIEYNAKFPPPMSIAQAYNSAHVWGGTDYFGASLVAITKAAAHKGYSLVGCNITGANAFFVRDDLLGNAFTGPFTAESHYEPARYFLWETFPSGHDPDWGSYVAY